MDLIENPEHLLSTAAINNLELPAELTQNNHFFGDNTSETLPQNVNFADGTDDILLEPSGMGTSAAFSDDSPATNEDPLTGYAINPSEESLLDGILRESSQLRRYFNPQYTAFGGNSDDRANAMTADKDGNFYITGTTNSLDLIVTPNAVQNSLDGATDAFVRKISPNGTLLYSTYFGGSGSDFARDIAVDDAGNIYITGVTGSDDFPVFNAFQNSFGGGGFLTLPSDAFVVKISADGNDIIYSSYIGGSNGDNGNGIAVDSEGNAYIAGSTFGNSLARSLGNANEFSGVGEFNGPRDQNDVFVTKISPDGSQLLYSAFLKGSSYDFASDIALDSNGNAYITGGTESSDFPVANATQNTLVGETDLFIAGLNSNGSELVYSTFYGGSDREEGSAIAVDNEGNIYVSGTTSKANSLPAVVGDFPVVDPFQSTFGGGFSDGVVVKINSDRSVGYASFLGGENTDLLNNIAVDATGSAYAVGTIDYLQDEPLNFSDRAFVGKISSNGENLDNSLLVDGPFDSNGTDITLDEIGVVNITGYTTYNQQTADAIFSTVGRLSVTEGPDSSIWTAFVERSYLAENPAVADIVYRRSLTGLDHWIEFGFSEGRLPQIDFDEDFYLETYPAVAEAVANGGLVNGLEHYVFFGAAENRLATGSSTSNTFPAFDESVYLAENPGVADAVSAGIFASGLEHWIENGFREGRQPQIAFDEDFYLETYSGVAEAVANGTFANALEHYVFFGAAENRLAAP